MIYLAATIIVLWALGHVICFIATMAFVVSTIPKTTSHPSNPVK